MDDATPPTPAPRSHAPDASALMRYYDEGTEKEWARLDRHRTEHAVTLRALAEYLPPAPRDILDIGGGPGRYAITLAEQGYQVTLLDLSQANLDFAREQAAQRGIAIQRYLHGNAVDLAPLPAESFDAALLMGPLYHLHSETDRRRAVSEAWRTLRPNGLVFAVFITRYGALRDFATRTPTALMDHQAEWDEILRTGVYHADLGVGFTDAYFAHPSEVTPLMESVGFETVDLIGCEGVVARNEERVNQLTGAAWEAWVDLNYRAGRDPTMYGASDHLLYIGRKGERE